MKSKVNIVRLRPNPRLPKIMALAVLLDKLRRDGQTAPKIVMMPEDQHPVGDGIYALDCMGNGYRERKASNELEVVMKDFDIDRDSATTQLFGMLYAHNTGAERHRKFFMNASIGSVGFFTVAGWSLIELVPHSHWRWVNTSAIEEGPEGQLVLEQNGRPKFLRAEVPQELTADDFLGMCLDVVATRLARLRLPEPVRDWKDAANSKIINSLLNAKFTAADLARRTLKGGNFEFPTLSRYIRDLYELGSNVDDIRNRIRPWLRLWEVIGECFDDANELKPLERFSLSETRPNGDVGVAFDLTVQHQPEAENNPLIHQRWLGKRDEHDQPEAHVVIVRRETGHTAIFVKRDYEDRMLELWGFLNRLEPGRWFFQGGNAIYNGSYSRTDVLPSEISVVAPPMGSDLPTENLVRIVRAAVSQTYEFAKTGGLSGALQ